MDENIKDQDVLLVKEKGNHRLNVVAGMDENGKLKTAPPTQEHQQDFMNIDKHSGVLENIAIWWLRIY